MASADISQTQAETAETALHGSQGTRKRLAFALRTNKNSYRELEIPYAYYAYGAAPDTHHHIILV